MILPKQPAAATGGNVAMLDASMRPKVNLDTHFFLDPDSGVYFRNNEGSFRMEGRSIHQWIEQLLPAFDGQTTLGELTDGLPDEYRQRVYQITEILYQNGFLRDVSTDFPHTLTADIIAAYQDQVAFLDHVGGSGAHRFERYRQSRVLAVGEGSMFLSLVHALLESGLPKFHVLAPTLAAEERQRLHNLAEHARKLDPDVDVVEMAVDASGFGDWQDVVKGFDAVLYVSESGDMVTLQQLEAACRHHRALLLPALCAAPLGMAGPLIHPGDAGGLAAYWRRLHRSLFEGDGNVHGVSVTAGAVLANVVVFELLKATTGLVKPTEQHPFFVLNLDTLEGAWHVAPPHPLPTGQENIQRLETWEPDLDMGTYENRSTANGDSDSRGEQLLGWFQSLTSPVCGIFHVWDEGDLPQLPLALCRVQPVNPLSEGPATLLPEVVCAGLTHEAARRAAGLIGIEQYVLRLLTGVWPPPGCAATETTGGGPSFTGVGAGETVIEGIVRALQQSLTQVLKVQLQSAPAPSGERIAPRCPVQAVPADAVRDETCQRLLQALRVLDGDVQLALGEAVYGFPVMWVASKRGWFGSVGFCRASALRRALERSLTWAMTDGGGRIPAVPGITLKWNELCLESGDMAEVPIVPAADEDAAAILDRARRQLNQRGIRMDVYDLSVDPFVKDGLAGVFGVQLCEGERA